MRQARERCLVRAATVGGVPVDPAPFLSTVILASAALVAIVGGLLVARFVGLDSDQQTSRKLLGDAEDRLTIATKRATLAREDLARWHAEDFLDENDVAEALATGQSDVSELRKLASTRLSDNELRGVVALAVADVASFRGWLSQDPVLDRIRAAGYEWRTFRRASDDMPALACAQLAQPVFENLAGRLAEHDAEQERIEQERRRAEEERRRAEAAEKQARHGSSLLGLAGLGSGFRIADRYARLGQLQQLATSTFKPPDYGQISGLVGRPPNAALIEANRYDDLVAADVRARQRVEDLREELRRLRQQHADVIRPDARLWWAVVILVAYAIAGVAVPLWVMSKGPVNLQAVRWTFWPFAAGMVVLLGYIAVYLFGLTRRRRKWAADAAAASSPRAAAAHGNIAWLDTLTPPPTAGAGSAVQPSAVSGRRSAPAASFAAGPDREAPEKG
jgi:hypothetical protein